LARTIWRACSTGIIGVTVVNACTDLAQKAAAGFGVSFGLDAARRRAVDDAEDAAPRVGFGHDDGHGVSAGAVDPADLRARLDRVEDVDRKGVFEDEDERVARAYGGGILGRRAPQLRIVPLDPDQAGTGRLAERHAELGVRAAGDDQLVKVLGRLDEVTLTHDDVAPFRDPEGHLLEFHRFTADAILPRY